MTAQELYDQIGADYNEVISRLRADRLVARFVVRFLDDTSVKQLFAAWEQGDEQAAFKAAHAAKGVCANLALTPLVESSTVICEALREGNEELRAQTDIDAYIAKLKQDYAASVAAIEAFAQEQ